MTRTITMEKQETSGSGTARTPYSILLGSFPGKNTGGNPLFLRNGTDYSTGNAGGKNRLVSLKIQKTLFLAAITGNPESCVPRVLPLIAPGELHVPTRTVQNI